MCVCIGFHKNSLLLLPWHIEWWISHSPLFQLPKHPNLHCEKRQFCRLDIWCTPPKTWSYLVKKVELKASRPVIGQKFPFFFIGEIGHFCNFVPGTLKSGMEKNITWFGTAKSAIYPTLKFIELFPWEITIHRSR